MPTKEKYANEYASLLTMSAVDTLTFSEINLGLTIFNKQALLIQRLEMSPTSTTWHQLLANTDRLTMGLVNDEAVASLIPNDARVLQYHEICPVESGAPATLYVGYNPIIHDFSTLPGGGLLCTPRPLYFAADTTGFAAAGSVYFKIYFQVLDLSEAEYLELLEARRSY